MNMPRISDRPGLFRCIILGILLVVVGILFWLQYMPAIRPGKEVITGPRILGYRDEPQPNHRHVLATVFWIGEAATEDNRRIANRSSAWVTDWVGAYGGIDDPDNRCGYRPCSFQPRENPFYFALPFNDYTPDGQLKPESVLRRIPWYTSWPLENQSVVKNRWIRVDYQGRAVYAQWEDVGPFGEDDVEYVFGDQPPKAGVGLDLSPACADYLRLDGEERVSWRFVDARAVPDGPWKEVVTTSGLNYR